jgi:hypothetical protein
MVYAGARLMDAFPFDVWALNPFDWRTALSALIDPPAGPCRRATCAAISSLSQGALTRRFHALGSATIFRSLDVFG